MTTPHLPLADPQLLDYYTSERLYMYALAQEFAQQHPKIAARLGMQAGEIGDPYVERLLQASSFVNARTQMRIDAAFPELMQPMLETVYPNYVRQTPSIGVARLYPGHESGHLGQGFLIPRGTAFTSHTPAGENTSCIFRSSQDVTVYPLRIRLARVTLIPPDIPSLGLYVPDGQRVHGAVRLTLETTNGASIAALDDLDRLPLYLAGDERIASHLFELVHAAGIATVMAAPGQFAEGLLYGVTRGAVVHEGIDPAQAVLPDVPRRLHGHGLMQEYFACPARFWFFALTGLARGLKAIEGNAVEIVTSGGPRQRRCWAVAGAQRVSGEAATPTRFGTCRNWRTPGAGARGGKCLSKEYLGAAVKLVWECRRGHTWTTKPETVLAGHWCPQCAYMDQCISDRSRRKYESVDLPGYTGR